MKTPLFSVLIPTKGRSFLIPNAIRSVLQQTFEDFEVVLIDNDDGDATRQAAAGFTDPRFRYVRSGNRSMPDNWDFAFDQARADYVCLIEDKQALKRHALERLAIEVERHKPQSVRWLNDFFDDLTDTPRVWKSEGNNQAEFRTSDDILRSFVSRPRRDYVRLLPIPHFGCIHQSLLRKIKSGPMGRLCPPVSPDYTLAFLQLAYADAVLHIHEALVVFVTKKHSNGQASILKLPAAQAFTKELGGKESIYYDWVPVKARTIPGSIYNDYLHVQALVKERLSNHNLSWPMYFSECYLAMQLSVSFGADMTVELAEWNRAFAEQPSEVQQATREIIGKESGGPWIKRAIKATGNALGVPAMERTVKAFVRKRITKDPAWQFPDAMSYIEGEYTARQAAQRQAR
jgi:hypothetical protein